MGKNRKFVTVKGSDHGCCFDYSVKDADSKVTICECFTKADADLITAALNHLNLGGKTVKAKNT